MALEFNKNHNLAAILLCDHPSAENYQEGMGFFKNSLLRFALSASPTLYADQLQQFWRNAVIQENDEGYEIITSRVNGEDLIINETTIREDLHLYDEQGVWLRERVFVEETFRRMGYELDFPRGAFKKGHLGANWRFIMHIFIHCLSSRRGGMDELDERMGTAMALTCIGQVFNFSYNIFESMKKNVVDENKKFILYPRFVQIMINARLPQLAQGGPILEQKWMTHSLFLSLNKIYSNCKHSRAFTPYFQHMRDVAALQNPIPSPPREDLPLGDNFTYEDEEHDADSESDSDEVENDNEEKVENDMMEDVVAHVIIPDAVDDVSVQGDTVCASRSVTDQVAYSRTRKVKTLSMLKCESQEAEIKSLRSQEEQLHLQINKQIKLLKKQKKLIMKHKEVSLFWKQKAKQFRRKYLALKTPRNASNLGGLDDQHVDEVTVQEGGEIVLEKVEKGKEIVMVESSEDTEDDITKYKIMQRKGYAPGMRGGDDGFEYVSEEEDELQSVLKISSESEAPLQTVQESLQTVKVNLSELSETLKEEKLKKLDLMIIKRGILNEDEMFGEKKRLNVSFVPGKVKTTFEKERIEEDVSPVFKRRMSEAGGSSSRKRKKIVIKEDESDDEMLNWLIKKYF